MPISLTAKSEASSRTCRELDPLRPVAHGVATSDSARLKAGCEDQEN